MINSTEYQDGVLRIVAVKDDTNATKELFEALMQKENICNPRRTTIFTNSEDVPVIQEEELWEHSGEDVPLIQEQELREHSGEDVPLIQEELSA